MTVRTPMPPGHFVQLTDSFLDYANVRTGWGARVGQLHCPYKGPGEPVVLCAPEMVGNTLSPAERAEIATCLPRLLAALLPERGIPTTCASLLAGISKYADWEAYPHTEDEAYTLATAMLYFIKDYTPGYEMDAVTKPYVCEIISAWTRRPMISAELPTALALCTMLFGDAWCNMVEPLDASFSDVLVENARPPFLPGLCPAQDALVCDVLPDDMGLAP
jgi:hypothetical protein